MFSPADTGTPVVFSRLRQSFAIGSVVPVTPVTPVLPVASVAPVVPAIKDDVIERVFAKGAKQSHASVAQPVAQPVVQPVAQPAGVSPQAPSEEFSSDFLQQFLDEEKEEPEFSSLAAAVPTAVALSQENVGTLATKSGSATDQSRLVGQRATGTTKETPPLPSPPVENIRAVEPTVDLQFVDAEPTMEMPPEVESFLQKVEDHQNQLPQEVVIAEQPGTHPILQPIKQPVVILPITPQDEKIGAKKSPRMSIRWLVEWSRKVMKMFAGRVVYRTAT